MIAPTLKTETGYQCGKLHVTGLAPRLSQVLLLRALGKSVAEIAQLLGCSIANVKQAINTLFFKLNADSSPELITRAFQNGHLRFLSVVAALLIGFLTPVQAENQNLYARFQRAPRTQIARNYRSGKKETFMEGIC